MRVYAIWEQRLSVLVTVSVASLVCLSESYGSDVKSEWARSQLWEAIITLIASLRTAPQVGDCS